MAQRTLSTEEQLAAVKAKLGSLDFELQSADERLTRALSSTPSAESAADATPQREAGGRRGLPPLKGVLPPASPPLPGGIRQLDASVGSAGSTSSAGTSASGSAGAAPPALEGVPDGDDTAAARPSPEPAPTMEPLSAQLGGVGSSLGWIFSAA